MTRIPVEEVNFFSSKSPEHDCRLFEWNGGYYRAVEDLQSSNISNLFETGLLQDLIDEGMVIGTKKTSLKLKSYDLVLQHRNIDIVTYPFEWSAEALRDAILLWINLNKKLVENGFGLKDAHMYNILFDGTKPIFVDIDSIVPYESLKSRKILQDIRNQGVNPLSVYALDQPRIARSSLKYEMNGLTQKEYNFITDSNRISVDSFLQSSYQNVEKFTPEFAQESLRKVARAMYKKYNTIGSQNFTNKLNEVQDSVENLNIPSDSMWTNYHDDSPDTTKQHKFEPKQRAFADIYSNTDPQKMLDLGTASGWFAKYAAHRGSKVIACDVDEAVLNQLYNEAKRNQLDIQPVYMNLANPPSGFGWGGTRYRSSFDRFNCEFVTALALVHHLCFRHMADFDLIADTFAKFCTDTLVVEWISRDDDYVKKMRGGNKYSWYTLENFKNSLTRNGFKIFDTKKSNKPTRKILNCKKQPQYNK